MVCTSLYKTFEVAFQRLKTADGRQPVGSYELVLQARRPTYAHVGGKRFEGAQTAPSQTRQTRRAARRGVRAARDECGRRQRHHGASGSLPRRGSAKRESEAPRF
jgi:hypothetical protein